jgi:hypothetical protein
MADARLADGLLVAGYALAVPLTVFVPGFLRLWRRRETPLFVTAEAGAALISAGWALRGKPVPAVVNGAWAVGFLLVYVREGRKRARTARA